jgi:photosystem I P700 chlorophyll a apoprotein A2
MNGRTSSSRLFEFIGAVHDIESFQGVANSLDITQYIFVTHWGHLSVIFIWLSGTLFHIGWTGNYSYWKINPISTIAISHPIWDPHISVDSGTYISTPSYSGVYNILFSLGYQNEYQLYHSVLALEILALISLLLGKIHISKSKMLLSWCIDKNPVWTNNSGMQGSFSNIKIPLRYFSTYLEASGSRLNFHLGSIFGTFSVLWSGHIVHISIPASRGYTSFLSYSHMSTDLFNGSWSSFMKNQDSLNHVFGSSSGAGSSIISFIGGINPSTGSIHLSDISHHHLSIGILFIWTSHLYSSFFKGLGHRLSDIVSSSGLTLVTKYVIKSLHLQLALSLAFISIVVSSVAHQVYAVPSYPYISYDYVSVVALFVHHNWISSAAVLGSFSHASLFLIRDYSKSGSTNQDVVSRILYHKASLISHISWVSLFLGFHVLGLYVHNDSVVAFGEPYKQILCEPFIAQSISSFLSITNSFGYLGDRLIDMSYIKPGYSNDLIASSLTPGDFLSFHAVSLGLHVTSLILIKGSLDSQGSDLMPDKVQLGFGFSCDGPARGGTCDISSWDSFYLSQFWSLNSSSWLMFYFHWKHLLCWQSLTVKFEENSTYLNGWFRDYLWFNSSSLIRGYDSTGSNDLSVWSWTFLAAHLCWATGFMFLISWRGYWQELIDTILFMHLKTPFLYTIWSGNSYSPVALSIVQARFIGLVHFSVGLIATYGAFVLGSTS